MGFDWGLGAFDPRWMDPGRLGVPDAGWVSRNETVAWDGGVSAYAAKNDRVRGLSAGDVLFRFGWDGVPVLLAQKPWQAGLGQSLALVPAGSGLSLSGREELWFFRGGTWDEPGDNIFLWDFNMLETGGGLWFVNHTNPTGAHPGKPFNQCAAPLLVDRILAVAHGWGDQTGR